MKLRILYQDADFVAVDKPAGLQVHPPENRLIPSGSSCLHLLRKQLGCYLYPVHRLDRATSGVLLFALHAESAKQLSERFRDREIKKKYFAVVRGWLHEPSEINRPLKSERSPLAPKEARTLYRPLSRVELPYPTQDHPTSRYTLVEVEPVTGRMHQIRRHFAHISHPLLGDTVYGDGKHNRVFREILGKQRLLLKAYSLELEHPTHGGRIELHSRWEDCWHRVFDLFGVCPWEPRASMALKSRRQE